MYEELFNSGEEHIATTHPRIRAAVSEKVCNEKILKDVEEIKKAIASKDVQKLQDKFMALVPGFSREIAMQPSKGVLAPKQQEPLLPDNQTAIPATAFNLEP